jgi:hypothetical protein
LQIEPSTTRTTTMLRRNHLLPSLSTLLLSVIPVIILLSASLTTSTSSPPSSSLYPRLSASIEEVKSWMDATNSTEQKTEFGPCNASPSLGYLRTQLQLMLFAHTTDPAGHRLSAQPLRYVYYEKWVMEPYRSLLPEANAPSTSACYVALYVRECDDCQPVGPYLAVCLPNSDSSTQGTCVSCDHLETALRNRSTLLKDEGKLALVVSTCDLAEPKQNPGESPEQKNTTEGVRWFRWFLDSSFVFERKKAGDECSANPGLSKARSYLDILMGKHFGRGKEEDYFVLSLASPWKEGPEEEAKYEAVAGELNADGKWWEEKLGGIEDGKWSFGEVYCSREEGLACSEGKCVECGDERVKNNTQLREACDPEEVRGYRKGRSSGAKGGEQSSKFTAVILGLLVSTLFRWWW